MLKSLVPSCVRIMLELLELHMSTTYTVSWLLRCFSPESAVGCSSGGIWQVYSPPTSYTGEKGRHNYHNYCVAAQYDVRVTISVEYDMLDMSLVSQDLPIRDLDAEPAQKLYLLTLP